MTKEEYDNKMAEIEKNAKASREEVIREYALSNNEIKKGDAISDHNGSIIVERIRIVLGFMSNYPECVYRGPCIRKDGKPFKNGKHADIHQSNIGKK